MPIKELWVDLDPEEQRADVRAKRKVLNKVLQGNWNTLLKGEGMEFAGFRVYTYEDDASRIDWRASLRSSDLLVREYEEYKSLNVYIFLDVSDNMLFSSQEKLKAEYGAEIAFSLADAILKTGDAVGLGMFNEKIIVNIPPNIGAGAYTQIRRALRDKNNYGGKSNIKNVLKLINASVEMPALIILISDFIGFEEEGWEGYLDIIATRMDLVGIMLRDPRDSVFPTSGGQFTLQHPTSGESMLVDVKKASNIYKSYVAKQESKIKGAFMKTNSGFVSLKTNKDLYDPILAMFYRRGSILGAR